MVIFELVEVVTPETTKDAASVILPLWVKAPTTIVAFTASRVCEFIFKVPISVVASPITSLLTTLPRSFNVPGPLKFAL